MIIHLILFDRFLLNFEVIYLFYDRAYFIFSVKKFTFLDHPNLEVCWDVHDCVNYILCV